MAQWIPDPQGRQEVEKVSKNLKLPVWQAWYKGKFRDFWNEVWGKIDDSYELLKTLADGKVSKTGDTMTGQLEIKINPQHTADFLYLYRNNDKIASLGGGADDFFIHNSVANTTLQLKNDGRAFYPALNLETYEKEVVGAINELKNRIIDNIEILKKYDAKLGEVYEVLGYYNKDDGASHNRIIANVDDGSGVQLENGLWANILHNGDRIDVRFFGMVKDDVNKAVLNKQILTKLFAKNFKLKINDKFYIDSSLSTKVELENANIDLKGYSYDSELEFVNIEKSCFYLFGDIKFIIEGLKLTNNDTSKQLYIFYVMKYDLNGTVKRNWTISIFEFNKNKVYGQMRVCYAEGHNDEHPSTVKTRFNVINITYNYFEELKNGIPFSFYDTPFEICNISNNRVLNFSNCVVFIAISNDKPYEKEFYQYMKKTFINENDVLEEIENEDFSGNGYHCFVLLEGEYVEVTNNKVEGLKSLGANEATVYDFYLSCRNVVFKNNITKNIGGFNNSPSSTYTILMMSKQGSDTTEKGVRIYQDNVYIIEKEFLDRFKQGSNKALLLYGYQGKFESWTMKGNVFKLEELSGVSNQNQAYIKNIYIENNLFDIKKGNGNPLFNIATKEGNDNARQIICNNTFNLSQGALTLVKHSFVDKNHRADLVEISDNTFNGKIGFARGLLTKMTSIKRNTVEYPYTTDSSNYFAFSYQDLTGDLGDLIYVDNFIWTKKDTVCQLGNGIGINTAYLKNTYFQNLIYSNYRGITFLKDSVEEKDEVFYCRYKLYHYTGIEEFTLKFKFGYDITKQENYLEVETAAGTTEKLYYSTFNNAVYLKKNLVNGSVDIVKIKITKTLQALVLQIEEVYPTIFIKMDEEINVVKSN